jgi:hypothetical protein
MLAIAIILETPIYFLDGYYAGDWDFSIILFFIVPIRVILILVVLGQIIGSIFSRSYNWKYTILWVLLTSISIVPKDHYSTFGAIAYMQNANPTSVIAEARNMMNIYKPMTYFGHPHRWPLNNPRPLNEVPQGISEVHKGEVLVVEHAVLLGRGSLAPSFRGFVIFQEGFDPWVNEKQIVLQDFWYASWKIRIIDGLYWYKVNGYDNPFLEQFFKSDI